MRLNKLQRDRIRRYIIDGMLMRLSTQENIIYINSKIRVKLSDRYVRQLRKEITGQRLEEYKRLKMQRYDFVLQFLERIEEIKNLQKRQWDMYNDNEGNVMTQQMCMKELHSLTVSLANLYDILPTIALTEASTYGDSESILSKNPENEFNSKQQQQQQEERQGKSAEFDGSTEETVY